MAMQQAIVLRWAWSQGCSFIKAFEVVPTATDSRCQH
jgi:hypothetical protein